MQISYKQRIAEIMVQYAQIFTSSNFCTRHFYFLNLELCSLLCVLGRLVIVDVSYEKSEFKRKKWGLSGIFTELPHLKAWELGMAGLQKNLEIVEIQK